MGKFYNGILGTMTGKVGGVVGRTWKGINTVSAYQPNVSNPRTNAQLNQRGKLTGLTRLASLLNSGIIKPLWDKDAKKMSGFNAWIQSNMPFADINGVNAYGDLIISKGKMTATPIINVEMAGGILNFEWEAGVNDAFSMPTDKAYIAIIATDTEEVFLSSGVIARSAGGFDMAIPQTLAGKLNIYLAFRREDGSIVSDSSYHAA